MNLSLFSGAEVADKWKIKPSASTWTNDDLSHIGISYHDTEMKLSDLMEKMALSKTEYPPEQSLIVDGIKKIWTFSFEFDERYLEIDKQQNMERGENGIKEVLQRLKGVQKIRNKRATIERNRYLLLKWYIFYIQTSQVNTEVDVCLCKCFFVLSIYKLTLRKLLQKVLLL